jgi:hypothetical protein
LSPAAFRTFANDPFVVSDRFLQTNVDWVGKLPRRLPSLPIDASVPDVDLTRVRQMRRRGDWRRLIAFLDAALTSPSAGVTACEDVAFLFAAVLSLLPPSCRVEYSLSSGLVFSHRRPFRLVALPPDRLLHRRLTRQTGMIAVDFSRPVPDAWSPRHTWAAFAMAACEGEAWDVMSDAVADSARGLRCSDLERAARQLSARRGASPDFSPDGDGVQQPVT